MERQYPDPVRLPYELPVFPDGQHVSFSDLTFMALDERLPKEMKRQGMPGSRFEGTLEEKVLSISAFDFALSYLYYRTGFTDFASPYPREKEAFHALLDAEADKVAGAAAAVGKHGEACIRVAM